jgi:lysophospholipase L1-like esterase
MVAILSIFLLMSCSTENPTTEPIVSNTIVKPVENIDPTNDPTAPIPKTIKYLALGDSYTIGQSVCEICRFPEQLKTSLKELYPETNFSLKIIATTGWTTSNLISSVNAQNLESNYDLVTLLIGVNNQFQHLNFSLYEKEFPELLDKAILLAKNNTKNVIVLSIPDYAYTPFAASYSAEGRTKISIEIDKYNNFAADYCKTKGVDFISITSITRMGLQNQSLVASDGLHPSESAYKQFVSTILPKVKVALEN